MKNPIYTLTFSVLLFITSSAFAQTDLFRKQGDVLVTKNGTVQTMAWCGGTNNPQFALGDFNDDKVDDLALFDHNYKVRTFISNGNGVYTYNPIYEVNFPAITTYIKLIDYNNDSIPDLVHRGMNGFSVYKGSYVNKKIAFAYFKEVRYTTSTGPVNAYVENNVDIPMIFDVDNDGDLDFLSYDAYGTRISLYKNCRVEEGLPSDSIRICLENLCWGRTKQIVERTHILGSLCTLNQNLYSTCKGCSTNKVTHVGNTLCAFDADGDGDMDYLNGNISYSDVQYFENGKADYNYPIDTIISQDTIWGSNGKDVHIKGYPAAFWMDIDQDNDKDLLFTPHDQYTENYNTVQLYENVGTDAAPDFRYKTDDYLISEMIDIGAGAYPTLYDYDKDGKKDLFIGSDGYYQPNGRLKSRVTYYKNTSTSSAVSFEFVTDDFMNLSSQNYEGIALAFGDVNGDTLDDMVIGRTDGTLALYLNTASSSSALPIWTVYQSRLSLLGTLTPVDVGDFAAPCIYDIDKDGDNDIIVGNQLGDLVHIVNNGSTPNNIGFLQGSNNVGGIKVVGKNPIHGGNVYGYSAPYIGPIDNTGVDYLMIGTAAGQIYQYTGFQNGNISVPFVRLDSNYSYVEVVDRATPAFANLDNSTDGLYELIVGNFLGGVNYYRQDFPVSVSSLHVEKIEVNVYPNPASNTISVNWGGELAKGSTTVVVMNMLGQKMLTQYIPQQYKTTSIDVSSLSPGVYYCVVQSANNKAVAPFVITK